MVTIHITAVNGLLSKVIHGDDILSIENVLDELGFYVMKILLAEIAKEYEQTSKEEEILKITNNYLA